MKIRLSFKCPEATNNTSPPFESMSEEECNAATIAIEKWVEHDEYLTVEIDTETGTCTPIEAE